MSSFTLDPQNGTRIVLESSLPPGSPGYWLLGPAVPARVRVGFLVSRQNPQAEGFLWVGTFWAGNLFVPRPPYNLTFRPALELVIARRPTPAFSGSVVF